MIAILTCVGCKEDYSDPKAFLQKYIVENEAKKFCSDARMRELRLSGIEMSNVRIGTQYGMSVVCATIRLVPESDEIVYASIEQDYGVPGMRGGIKILTKEERNSFLSADVVVPRVKMDTGVYAPDNLERDHNYISGWGSVNTLAIANKTPMNILLFQPFFSSSK